MTPAILPGIGERLDPDRMTKIEICCAEATRAEVRIFVADETAPRLVVFPDKGAAVNFYRKLWLLRTGEILGDGQIENLIEGDGP
jgi:hypothetical protein